MRKKITFLKTMLLAVVLMVGSGSAFGQLLNENFSYTIGTDLTANSWVLTGSTATPTVSVSAAAITYTGYLSSGIGAGVTLATSGQDVNKTFTAQTSGAVYASCLVNVTTATTTGDYFFHLGATIIGSTYHGRVYVKKDATGNIAFGISRAGAVGTAIFTPYSYVIGTTYLLVLKYTIVSGLTNDISAIYINPTLNDVEPTSGWITSTDTPADLANLGTVALRQGSSSAAPALSVDGIRVATTWSDIVGASVSTPTLTVSPATLSGFTYNYGSVSPSAEQSFTVSGANLTNDVSISLPTNYEISTVTGASFVAATVAIPILKADAMAGNTIIYARLKTGLAVGTYNEDITISSTGVATSKTVACSGSVACVTSSLAFATATINKSVGNVAFTQAATSSNAVTAITYASSVPAVATVDANTGEVTILIAGSTTITATQAAGSGYCASTASYTVNVASSNPTITVLEALVPSMTAVVGSADAETITVSGTNLIADISLALTGTNADQFSLSTDTVAQTTGTAESTVVTITYTPTVQASHTATLTLSSSTATSVVYTLTGAATWAPLTTPVATASSANSTSSFNANWEAVAGATSYDLNVYTKTAGSAIATDLFISEYVEGTSYNKAIEIYNGTGATVDLSVYSLKKQTNGAGAYSSEQVLSGTLANKAVYVLANTSSNATILGLATATNNTTTSFNGNDAVALFKNGVQIDEVGMINQVAVWGADLTLIRKSSVLSPVATYAAADWDTQATDYITNLGLHTMGSAAVSTPVVNFAGITELSQSVTGLTNGTNYYYTVTAKNANVSSLASNEITAPTTATGLSNVNNTLSVTTLNGKIQLNAAAGETVNIYNAIGQQLLSKMAVEGLNTIAVATRGVVIVKVGTRTAKVIM